MTTFKRVLIILFTVCVFCINNAYSSTIPEGQDVGSTQKSTVETKKKKTVVKELIKGKKEADIEKEGQIKPKAPKEAAIAAKTRVLVEEIKVEGVTLLKKSLIRSIINKYAGKELTLASFKEVADAITTEYRKRGYVTSLAYIPPQRIDNNVLTIKVLEGKVGAINISGNKFFKDSRILKYVRLKKGDIFNYDVLKRNINRLNEHPDRSAKVVLERGKEFAQTDINVKVKDELPIHVNLTYDNYNSRYLDKNKFAAEFKTTNFLGLDHMLSLETQLGEHPKSFHLYSGKYLINLTSKLATGLNYNYVKQKLGGEVKALKIEGTGHIVSPYCTYRLIQTDDLTANLNAGFDYKQIKNEVLGVTFSEDKTRVAKFGFDMDLTDKYNGRTILTHEFDFGIPNIFNGLKDTDTKGSRAGAGGNFFRTITNAARVQNLPASLALMLKGSMQLTGYNLVATEQFQIGGFNTVRGYPRSEYVGDRGYNTSAELYIPPYLIPKTLKIPFTQKTLYDSFRFITFFDWGLVRLKNPQVGEKSREKIYSTGCGLRFNLEEKMAISFDYGFALGQEASDGSNSRGYVEVKLFF